MLADEQKQGPPDAAGSGQEEKSAGPDSERQRVSLFRGRGTPQHRMFRRAFGQLDLPGTHAYTADQNWQTSVQNPPRAASAQWCLRVAVNGLNDGTTPGALLMDLRRVILPLAAITS